MFDKIYKHYDSAGKQQVFAKLYEPGKDKSEDQSFKIQKVLEFGNVSKNVSRSDARPTCTPYASSGQRSS